MKKNAKTLIFALVALVTLSLSSCVDDDDTDVAATLNGTWHGVLSQDYYNDNYQDSSWETEFRFNNYSTSATSGNGREYDYDPVNYNTYYTYYDFRWDVSYGNIYLHYANGDELVIRNYRLSDSRLRGTLEDINGTPVADLDLARTSYWPWDDTRSTKSADEHKGMPRIFK